MHQPHILVVCQHYWPESFRINDITEYFIEREAKVDVLCGIPNYPKGAFFDGYGLLKNRTQKHGDIRIRRAAEIPRGNNSNVRIFLNYISFPLASLAHIPRLLTRKYDKILLYQLSPVMMSIAGIIIGKIRRVETTMYVLDLWPENLFSVIKVENKILRKIAQKISHWHYKKADKLVVLSERMKTRLAAVPGIDKKKIIILPQACEKLYEQEILDKKLQLKYSDGFNLVFTGNISPAQSFETVLDAAEKIQAKKIGKINWIIVGDGMSKAWLEAEVKARGLSDFYFEGQHPVDDMPRYTTIADGLLGCLVKSELLEATIPAKIMSYIASGKPIILAMDGEVQSLVNDRIRCGFAGPAGDSEILYRNIEKLYLASLEDRSAMGKRARDYHFKHFERNIILGKLYDFMFS